MYLHEDKEAFTEVIQKVQDETGYELSIIEKDYYVSMMLKALANADVRFVFKGGTSLSKAYKVINRFSEDIDLTVTQKPTQGERVHMADKIMECAANIGLRIINRNDIRRRGQFNRFVFEYDSAFTKTIVNPQIIVEVFVALLAFPVEEVRIDSFVGSILEKYNPQAQAEYDLIPFPMAVQSIKRTLVDKIFALCDYYLSGNANKYSRHIYDIYQILMKISLKDIDAQLIADVRCERSKDSRCLSAQENVNLSDILTAIIDTEFFKEDYNLLTRKILFDALPYERAVTALEEIVKSNIFTQQ